MKNEDFVEASAHLRVAEKRMLNNQSINRIIDAPTSLDALRLVSQNSEYDFSSIDKTEDYEPILKDGLKKLYDKMYKLSKHREVIDIPAAKYDFHNLKVALKSKYTNKERDTLYSCISDVNPSDIKDFINEPKSSKNEDFYGDKEAALPSHLTDALEDAGNVYQEKKDPGIIDIVLDRHMFAHMLMLCEKVSNPFITEYVQLSIDFYNIKTLMRVKNMQKGSRFLNESLIPGGLTDTDFFLENYDKSTDALTSIFYYKYFGDIMKNGMEEYSKTGNYSGLERVFDDYLMEYVKKAKYIAFGPEVLFAYLISKENEIRQIRILISCKNNNIPADALKERLRDNYA